MIKTEAFSAGLCDASLETGGAHCSWASCYSDVSFVKAILAQLKKEFCLDTSAIFAAGASNGAMLVHHLAAEMPADTFAALSPIYGLPLKHHLNVPASLSTTPILAIHDRWDQIIPYRTGAGVFFLFVPSLSWQTVDFIGELETKLG